MAPLAVLSPQFSGSLTWGPGPGFAGCTGGHRSGRSGFWGAVPAWGAFLLVPTVPGAELPDSPVTTQLPPARVLLSATRRPPAGSLTLSPAPRTVAEPPGRPESHGTAPQCPGPRTYSRQHQEGPDALWHPGPPGVGGGEGPTPPPCSSQGRAPPPSRAGHAELCRH